MSKSNLSEKRVRSHLTCHSKNIDFLSTDVSNYGRAYAKPRTQLPWCMWTCATRLCSLAKTSRSQVTKLIFHCPDLPYHRPDHGQIRRVITHNTVFSRTVCGVRVRQTIPNMMVNITSAMRHYGSTNRNCRLVVIALLARFRCRNAMSRLWTKRHRVRNGR
ncbi:hypothetical protein BC832DRAFT_427491 [Gaertneriomyces semiglobifer]|nr:hypothetical protein BC832DRAFT_427491 [Gaertneriomyces semiglobifer]